MLGALRCLTWGLNLNAFVGERRGRGWAMGERELRQVEEMLDMVHAVTEGSRCCGVRVRVDKREAGAGSGSPETKGSTGCL